MRAVVQRVSEAEVIVENNVVGSIKNGILVFLGIEDSDNHDDMVYMFEKTVNLRIFEDEEGKMNKSLMDIDGEILVISQFTLHGDCRKGRRPSFITAARPEKARDLYEAFIAECRKMEIKTEAGIFQADMKVRLINDGPVTLLIDSKKTF